MFFALNTVADGLNDELVTMAENGQADAVTSLLDKGADVNARNAFGLTALMESPIKRLHEYCANLD